MPILSPIVQVFLHPRILAEMRRFSENVFRRFGHQTQVAIALSSCAMMMLATAFSSSALAQHGRTIELTMESTVQMAAEHSFRVRQLQLGIERSRRYLLAEKAELKSRVYVNLRTPEFAAVSEHKWNANLQRDELVRENSRLWQAEFSIRQPVILFGHPTNGYLSLNNRVYRYTQVNGGRDVSYYNRYFVRSNSRFFLPTG